MRFRVETWLHLIMFLTAFFITFSILMPAHIVKTREYQWLGLRNTAYAQTVTEEKTQDTTWGDEDKRDGSSITVTREGNRFTIESPVYEASFNAATEDGVLSYTYDGKSAEFNPSTLKWDTGEVITSILSESEVRGLDKADELVGASSEAAGIVFDSVWGKGIDIGAVFDADRWWKIIKIGDIGDLGKIPKAASNFELWFEVVGEMIPSVLFANSTDISTGLDLGDISIKPIKAWDSSGNLSNPYLFIESNLVQVQGTNYLVKKIPVGWLESATFPIYTDLEIAWNSTVKILQTGASVNYSYSLSALTNNTFIAGMRRGPFPYDTTLRGGRIEANGSAFFGVISNLNTNVITGAKAIRLAANSTVAGYQRNEFFTDSSVLRVGQVFNPSMAITLGAEYVYRNGETGDIMPILVNEGNNTFAGYYRNNLAVTRLPIFTYNGATRAITLANDTTILHGGNTTNSAFFWEAQDNFEPNRSAVVYRDTVSTHMYMQSFEVASDYSVTLGPLYDIDDEGAANQWAMRAFDDERFMIAYYDLADGTYTDDFRIFIGEIDWSTPGGSITITNSTAINGEPYLYPCITVLSENDAMITFNDPDEGNDLSSMSVTVDWDTPSISYRTIQDISNDNTNFAQANLLGDYMPVIYRNSSNSLAIEMIVGEVTTNFPPSNFAVTDYDQFDIDMEWTKGNGSETLILARQDQYPTKYNDIYATTVYDHGTANTTTFTTSCNTNWYFSLWAYDPVEGYYSAKYDGGNQTTEACPTPPPFCYYDTFNDPYQLDSYANVSIGNGEVVLGNQTISGNYSDNFNDSSLHLKWSWRNPPGVWGRGGWWQEGWSEGNLTMVCDTSTDAAGADNSGHTIYQIISGDFDLEVSQWGNPNVIGHQSGILVGRIHPGNMTPDPGDWYKFGFANVIFDFVAFAHNANYTYITDQTAIDAGPRKLWRIERRGNTSTVYYKESEGAGWGASWYTFQDNYGDYVGISIAIASGAAASNYQTNFDYFNLVNGGIQPRGYITSKTLTKTSAESWEELYSDNDVDVGANITYEILDASANDTVICGNISYTDVRTGYDISNCTAGVNDIKLRARIEGTGMYNVAIYDWGVTCTSTICPPTVDCLEVSNITMSSARLGGYIVDYCNEYACKRGFVWGNVSQPDPGNATPGSANYTNWWIEPSSGCGSWGVGEFYYNINVSNNTTYYFRATGNNSEGYNYSDECSFTSDQFCEPELGVLSVTSPCNTTSTLGGYVLFCNSTDPYFGNATARGFVWGNTSQGYPGDVHPSASGYDTYWFETGVFSPSIFYHNAITANETIYIRTYANYTQGNRYSTQGQFQGGGCGNISGPCPMPTPSPPSPPGWRFAANLTEVIGTIVSGNLSDTYSDNGVRLQLSELNGPGPVSDYIFTFQDTPGWNYRVHMDGYYQGNPAHNVKVSMYNYSTLGYANLTGSAQDIPSGAADADYSWNVPSASYRNGTDGEMRFRVTHLSNGAASHYLWIDLLELADCCPACPGNGTPGLAIMDMLTSCNITTCFGNTSIQVRLGGYIQHLNFDGNVTDRGFVWDTMSRGDPGNTTPGASGYANFTIESGIFGVGAFYEEILTANNTTYYVRSWGNNSLGYSYSNEYSFIAGRGCIFVVPDEMSTGIAILGLILLAGLALLVLFLGWYFRFSPFFLLSALVWFGTTMYCWNIREGTWDIWGVFAVLSLLFMFATLLAPWWAARSGEDTVAEELPEEEERHGEEWRNAHNDWKRRAGLDWKEKDNED